MKLKILTNTDIKPDWLNELKALVPWEIEIVKTEDKLPGKWNPYHASMWGDFDWLRREVGEADIRCFCTTKSDLRMVGIDGHIGMYDVVDSDSKMDFYIGLPPKLDKRAKTNGFKSNFAWLVIHEYLHGEETQSGTPDRVHVMEAQGRLKELLIEHQQNRQIRFDIIKLLQSVVSMLNNFIAKPTTLLHPVEKYKSLISQKYGKDNIVWYPRTGKHIGLDYPLPENTYLLAPWDGEVIVTGYSPSLGNYCHYAYEFEGQKYVERWLHLRYAPKLGKYSRGNFVCQSGNTGNSTNPHWHQDIWLNEVRLDLINKTNWDKLTVDPQKHYSIK